MDRPRPNPMAGEEGEVVFCYLMINYRVESKINTFIDTSVHPFRTVEEHNKGSTERANGTRSAAPNWELSVILGPFRSESDADAVATRWRNNRGIGSRRERGIDIAREKGVICWDREAPAEDPGGKKAGKLRQ